MSEKPPDLPRSPLSMGLSWATRVTALGLEFVLPTLGGYYLDKQWGTQPLVTVLGSAAGFAAGMVHLLRIAKEGSRR